ncbi:MAG: hypothetical protein AAFN11_19925 [Chloroflexota bacterium]
MSEKSKHRPQAPYGNLGRAFKFTQDDLSANRAGYLTQAQQLEFAFWERRVFGWMVHVPPFAWIMRQKQRPAHKLVGKARKHHHHRVISTGSGGGGGGHQDVLSQHRIDVQSSADDSVSTFYVNEAQYHALPANIELTLYFDPEEHRIVSVERANDLT